MLNIVWAWLTVKLITRWFWFLPYLRIRMPRLSRGLILHGIRTYSGTEEAELHIFGSQGKAEVRKCNFTWWQNERTEAELQLFGSHGIAEVRKRNFAFLAIKASRVLAGKPNSQSRAEVRKRNFTSLEVPAEMKCASGPSHLWNFW